MGTANHEMATLKSQLAYSKQRIEVDEGDITRLRSEVESNLGEMKNQITIVAQLEKERTDAWTGCAYYESQLRRLVSTYDELATRVEALSMNSSIVLGVPPEGAGNVAIGNNAGS